MPLFDEYTNLEDAISGLDDDIRSINWSSAIAEIHTQLEKLHRGYFENATDPSGRKWAELQDVTIQSKMAKKCRTPYAILQCEWNLRDSLASRTGDSIRDGESNPTHNTLFFLVFGTSDSKSYYHTQDGWSSARLPRRPHVGVNEDFVDMLGEAVADLLVANLA